MSVVVGVTMVRDEADIIEIVIRHMATQVDALVVADNRSVDGTSDILHDLIPELQIPMRVIADDEVGYEQSRKMTALALFAQAQFNASWIVPFDADEIWYAPNGSIRNHLSSQPSTVNVVAANLFDHVASGVDDLEERNPVGRINWRRNYAAPLPKVAARWHPSLTIGMGNHDVSFQFPNTEARGRMAIRHFPYRSPEQIIRKIRNGAEAYAATDLPEHFGAHWRGWGAILESQGEDAIVELFHKWHWRESPEQPLVVDGERQGWLVFSPACDVTSIC